MDTPYCFVAHFIETFGPRKAGSTAETKAQQHLAEHLGGFCDHVAVEEFRSPLSAKFTSLRFFTFGYLAALLLPFWSMPAALIVGLVNALLFLFHFVLFHGVLNGLFPKVVSHNVIGSVEPREAAERTLIFSGHMDSTPEFIWWYWLKGWGARAMVVAGASWLFLPVHYALAMLIGWSVPWSFGWWCFVALTPLSMTFYFIHGNRVVEGAQDNLSGVAVAYEVVRRLANDPLQRTRVRMLSFGAEECGLQGSSAYVTRYHAQLKEEGAVVINLDGILDIDNMYVIKRELMAMQDHNGQLIDSLLNTFEECGLPRKKGTIPIGGTDATSFSARGIPATSIVGLPMGSLHPTYHTRLDTIEHLVPETMDRISSLLVSFAKAQDRRD